MLTTSSFEAESLRIFFEIIPSRMESRSFGLRPPSGSLRGRFTSPSHRSRSIAS